MNLDFIAGYAFGIIATLGTVWITRKSDSNQPLFGNPIEKLSNKKAIIIKRDNPVEEFLKEK